MEEKIFFEQGSVSVTHSRFIVDGQTYAINNVTSVKTGSKKANYTNAVLLCIIGLFFLLASLPLGYIIFSLIGVFLIVGGILIFKGEKDEYSVVLNTSAGENQALTSEDKLYIDTVVSALNNAIVSRT